ncbi:MAG: c-type cytochrome [Candidatus Competibacteraceae bacterium]|nr:c-type cytochrome [Candidatus Competibacteraceae bacterium]
MTIKHLSAIALALLIAPAAQASEELAKKYNCLACHQADKKVIGPSYQEVAAKYKGQADASTLLAEKIKKGGVGVWGQIPMPPNAAVPDEDMKALVDWIMAMAK